MFLCQFGFLLISKNDFLTPQPITSSVMLPTGMLGSMSFIVLKPDFALRMSNLSPETKLLILSFVTKRYIEKKERPRLPVTVRSLSCYISRKLMYQHKHSKLLHSNVWLYVWPKCRHIANTRCRMYNS